MISAIQVQTIDDCNANCIVCPRKWIYKTKHQMPESQFEEILKKIREAQGAGLVKSKVRFILQYRNEPLCDTGIIEKINMVKRLVNCHLEFYTNGILLPAYKDKLVTSDIDKITISNYGDTLEQWRKVAGIKISQERFQAMKKAGWDLAKKKNVREWEAWREGELFDFSTRAGLTRAKKPVEKVVGCEWERPYNWLHIGITGNLLLCCQDWKDETTYGNIFEDSLVEILKSERYQHMMQQGTGKRPSDKNFICKRCKFNKEK